MFGVVACLKMLSFCILLAEAVILYKWNESTLGA